MEVILDYIHQIEYSSIPSYVSEYVKVHVLDTLGALFAGSRAKVSQRLLSLIKGWQCRKEATVLLYGHKTLLPWASWLNSTMVRGFDYEPILMGGATHVPGSIIPAALNLAEYAESRLGKRISGKELIVSIVIGLDLNWRLRAAGRGKKTTGMGSGWLAETFSPIAIAALGGKLLEFTKEQINYAMAIGFCQSCGHYGATVGPNGGLMAQLSQGLGTKNGILAVLLAAKGFKAFKDIIGGKWGLYILFGDGKYDTNILLGNLGTKFDHLRPYVKKYPGCGALQAPVEATLRIVNKEDLNPEDVAEIKVKIDPLSYELVAEGKGNTLPEEGDALWDCFYAVALAVKKKRVSIEDFTEEGIKGSGILDLLPKIKIIRDKRKKVRMGAEVEIKTKRGYVYCEKIENLDSLEEQTLIEKFKNCCNVSPKRFSKSQIELIIKQVKELENLDSVTKLIKKCIVSNFEDE